MRKVLFALVGIAAMAMTSCFEGTGNSYTTSFSRVVTIDTTGSPVKFVADYTNEEFKGFSNLKTPEQLAQFGLRGAQRAEVYMQFDVDASYTQTKTMLQGRKIEVLPVTNRVPGDSLKPLIGWQQKPLGYTGYNPVVWVSGSYLNVLPVIPSGTSGKYYLTADKVVSDTLYFNLSASYETDDSKQYYDGIQCYDLRTLCDTVNGTDSLCVKMKELWSAMEQYKADSMKIVLTASFDINYYGKDTIMKQSAITNYFYPQKVFAPNY